MSKLTLILCTAVLIGTGCEMVMLPAAEAAEATSTATPEATPAPVAQQAGQRPTGVEFDACTLLTKEEVGAITGSAITDAKSSQKSSEAMTTAQCFYTATEFSRSINFNVLQPNPTASGGRVPRDVWHDSFARFSKPGSGKPEEEKEREEGDRPKGGRESEERERESKPPLRVEGLGEEAFWTSGIGGTLYVLKGPAFLRISVGGASKDEDKLNEAKILAAKALERL